MKKPELHGFRIYRQEPLSETFKRVILEQLGQMLELNGQYHKNPDFITHEIRKTTKRIRAVYRLFRQAAGDDIYLHGKELYGTLSQLLAEHRVSAVYIETMHRLASDNGLPVSLNYLEKRIAEQENKHKQLTHLLIWEQGFDQQLKQIVQTEMQKLITEPLFSCDITNFSEGLKNTYSKGRKSLKLILQQASAENLHNLRKKVKSYWNQMILLRPVWPSVFNVSIHQFDLLAERLGLDHDLAELEHFLSNKKIENDEDQYHILLEFIAKKRQHIQKSIVPLAMRLYAEKPEALAGKMKVYYKLFLGSKS
jgi:CHAD domain-containing protein